MTLDESVALSLTPDLSRVGLSDRLRSGDPVLLERARAHSSRARLVREQAAAKGMQVLPWEAPHFPAALLAISDMPPVLWYRGNLDALRAPAVAIVGSRAASPAAREIAARLGADLAARGITVVSGLARGVDSSAHQGALRSGRTVAVLGSGLDRIYPREHEALVGEIARDGLVVSEFPPGTAPLAFHFPMRNRLISGLSRAVVVVEANQKSGSLITAACALEQGRDVMAVPGNVLSGRSRGAHALIRDGAKIVECADDILEELGLDAGERLAGEDVSGSSTRTCIDPVLRAMHAGQSYDLDELAAESGIDGVRLLPRLLDLELQGLLRRIGGGRFIRQRRTC
ncbi:MAG: DNA-processing protein DprA [Acidobacteria bacterium]|nr:DNA-processing protein DprA [Acidobacteriota bacterium]